MKIEVLLIVGFVVVGSSYGRDVEVVKKENNDDQLSVVPGPGKRDAKAELRNKLKELLAKKGDDDDQFTIVQGRELAHEKVLVDSLKKLLAKKGDGDVDNSGDTKTPVKVRDEGTQKDGRRRVHLESVKRSLMLNLLRNMALDENMLVHSISKGQTTTTRHKARGCYYQDRDLRAAVSMCGRGVNGVILNEKDEMHIKPQAKQDKRVTMEERKKRSTNVATDHVISRVQRDADIDLEGRMVERIDESLRAARQKRGALPSSVTVELAIVVDAEFYKEQGNDEATVKEYVLKLINAVDLIYSKLTQPEVKLRVNSLTYIKDTASQAFIEEATYTLNATIDYDLKEAGSLLTNFSTWLKTTSAPVQGSYDHAMLISGYNLCSLRNDNTTGTPIYYCSLSNAGMAWTGAVCDVDPAEKVTASSISEDQGNFGSIVTLAHELGHNLGAPHDGSPADQYVGGPGATSCASNLYVMAGGNGGNSFSTCSQDQFRYFFGQAQASCLQSLSSNTYLPLPTGLPGSGTTIEDTCVTHKGAGSTYCEWAANQFGDTICDRLWCTNTDGGCGTVETPLDGTECGTDKVCYEKQCVLKTSLPDGIFGDDSTSTGAPTPTPTTQTPTPTTTTSPPTTTTTPPPTTSTTAPPPTTSTTTPPPTTPPPTTSTTTWGTASTTTYGASVDGGWSAWYATTYCSVTCGGGIKNYIRFCNNPEPANGGTDCPGYMYGIGSCNTAPCPPIIGCTQTCSNYLDDNNLRIRDSNTGELFTCGQFFSDYNRYADHCYGNFIWFYCCGYSSCYCKMVTD